VVLVVNGVVVVVDVGWVVELVDDVVDDGAVAVGPQNCTSEMSGVFPLPTFGRPPFVNVPESWGGVIEVNTDDGPPFTMTPDTASVEVQSAPDADAPVSVTTCSLPAGFSNV